MNEFSDTEIWIAVALAFGAGYFLVSFLARLMKTQPPAPPGRMNPPTAAPGYDPIALQEERCAEVLGVRPGADLSEIEQAYRQALAKYQAEKMTGPGEESNRLATDKIQEIDEAYAVLKRARAAK